MYLYTPTKSGYDVHFGTPKMPMGKLAYYHLNVCAQMLNYVSKMLLVSSDSMLDSVIYICYILILWNGVLFPKQMFLGRWNLMYFLAF